ncbi:MAG: hypothetical protein ABI372_10025, partial [Ginsengibacter sp.]
MEGWKDKILQSYNPINLSSDKCNPKNPGSDNQINKQMLDTETKRRIDTARDILVGKVPDPKSQ